MHWVPYDIPAPVTSHTEATAGVGVIGTNDRGHVGWGGMLPPRGHGVHHYRFRVLALDAMLEAPQGPTRDQLLERARGHVLAEGVLTGTFER